MTTQPFAPVPSARYSRWPRFSRFALSGVVLLASAAYVWTHNPRLNGTAPVEIAEQDIDSVAQPVVAAAPPDPQPAAAAPAVKMADTTTPAPATSVAEAKSAPSTPPGMSFPSVEKLPTYHDGDFRGNNAYAYYGEVAVRAFVENGKIVDVKVMRYPKDRKISKDISDPALVVLRKQAITRQSANVDMVSGATWTSKGYAESLAVALRKSAE